MGKLWRITLVTNPDLCNLRCGLCFLRQRGRVFGRGEMPWEIAERAVRKFAAEGISEVIPSTMGEPLLYSSFEKLERLVSELGLKLNVTTNGTFPGKGAALWAQELLPLSRDVKISCWGFSERSWNALSPGVKVRDFFENVRTVLCVRRELAERSKAPLSTVSLQMAVTQTNRAEVEEVVEWAAAAGVDRVKLNRAVFLSDREDLKAVEGISPDDFWNLPRPAHLKLEGTFLHPAGEKLRHCPFFGRELWILPDGSTEPCPDPENRFGALPPGKSRCEICQLFPQKPVQRG